ncbi:MAG TPA: hypothetical protein V6D17_21895 [Candidatus Obscuribacterales bacterium]
MNFRNGFAKVMRAVKNNKQNRKSETTAGEAEIAPPPVQPRAHYQSVLQNASLPEGNFREGTFINPNQTASGQSIPSVGRSHWFDGRSQSHYRPQSPASNSWQRLDALKALDKDWGTKLGE